MIESQKILKVSAIMIISIFWSSGETLFVLEHGRFYVKTFGKWQYFQFKDRDINL